ncbi:MAG: DoxX family membrane protein, partial [bacterium]|nr:DoxX family membrane protein [bacterium]
LAIRPVLLICGTALIFGFYPRLASVISLSIFILPLFSRGVYMLNYGAYYGEALVIFLLGGSYALYEFHKTRRWKIIDAHIAKYKFFILRLIFGGSMVFAALYAKFFHANLAIATVEKYGLDKIFHIEPQLFVFGALCVEVMIGLFFIIGFELRFTSLFFLAFLIASLFFFKEAVWPHLILIGTAISVFAHGYDRFTIESRFVKRKHEEPVF